MAAPMAVKHINLENLMDGWVSINEAEDPIAFRAWRDYRREILGCGFVPKYYSVPSDMPPRTQAEANIYAATLTDIRRSIGWSDARSTKHLKDARPWK